MKDITLAKVMFLVLLGLFLTFSCSKRENTYATAHLRGVEIQAEVFDGVLYVRSKQDTLHSFWKPLAKIQK